MGPISAEEIFTPLWDIHVVGQSVGRTFYFLSATEIWQRVAVHQHYPSDDLEDFELPWVMSVWLEPLAYPALPCTPTAVPLNIGKAAAPLLNGLLSVQM